MKIAYIANLYTLKGNSAAVRNNSLVSGFISLGHTVDVYTIRFPATRTSSFLNNGRLLFTELPGLSVNNKINRSLKNFSWLLKIKVYLQNLIFFPDVYSRWLRLFRMSDFSMYDILISSSDNKISHLIAQKINIMYPDLRWIQIWGDPWYGDMSLSKLMKLRIKDKERELLEKAYKVIYTSPLTRDMQVKLYPQFEDKLFHIPRSYFKHIKQSIISSPDAINILYSGALDKGRNISSFINAVKCFNESHTKRVVINVYGGYNQETYNYLSTFDFVHVNNVIDYNEMLDIHAESDVMLFIANPGITTQIPGKLYDYFGTDSLIICLVNDINDPVSNYLKKYSSKCLVIENEEENIKNAIDNIVNTASIRCPALVDFSPSNIAKKVLELL